MAMPEWHRKSPETIKKSNERFLTQWQEALSTVGNGPDAMEWLARKLTEKSDHASLIRALYDSQVIEKLSKDFELGLCSGLHTRVVNLAIRNAQAQLKSFSNEDIHAGVAALSAITRNSRIGSEGQKMALEEWKRALDRLCITDPKLALSEAYIAERLLSDTLSKPAKSYIRMLEDRLEAKRKSVEKLLEKSRN